MPHHAMSNHIMTGINTLKANPKMSATTINRNAQSDTFKAPSCCFEYAPYTALTIV